MNNPRILGIGTANPPVRLTQEQSFHAAGYKGERVRKIFLNSDIDFRHFYLEGSPNREESSDQLNQRYLRGAMKTGCQAILDCVNSAGTTVGMWTSWQSAPAQATCVQMWAAVSLHTWTSATTCRECRSLALDVRVPFLRCSVRSILFEQIQAAKH